MDNGGTGEDNQSGRYQGVSADAGDSRYSGCVYFSKGSYQWLNRGRVRGHSVRLASVVSEEFDSFRKCSHF